MRRLACLVALCLTSPLLAQSRAPTLWNRTGILPIDESSGVAVSRVHPGILWTHNDSGGEPRLYAVTLDGTLVARYQVLGARAVDWEDIAIGPCPHARDRTCLAIGDIGDNDESRTRVIVYFVEEPDPATASDTVVNVGPARAVRVRYQDRPRDAEALAIAPDGSLSIVTKGRTGAIIRFHIPADRLTGDSAVALAADTLPIVPQRMLGRWVTGAAVARDGETAVVRTYTEVFFFRVRDGHWVPDGQSCFLGPREPQGEAVDYLGDGTLVLTSERSIGQPAIHRFRC